MTRGGWRSLSIATGGSVCRPFLLATLTCGHAGGIFRRVAPLRILLTTTRGNINVTPSSSIARLIVVIGKDCFKRRPLGMASLRWREWATDPEQLRRLHLLEKVSLFAGLSKRQLGKLLVKLFEKEYEPGETIFLEGEPGKALFIVLDGRVRSFTPAMGPENGAQSSVPGPTSANWLLSMIYPALAALAPTSTRPFSFSTRATSMISSRDTARLRSG